MRIYVHIIAILLAMTLVSKPCVQVLTSHKSPEAIQTAAASGKIVKEQVPACRNKCLIARSESFRRELFPTPKAAGDGPRKTSVDLLTALAEPFIGQQRIRPPDKAVICSSQDRLHRICRLLI